MRDAERFTETATAGVSFPLDNLVTVVSCGYVAVADELRLYYVSPHLTDIFVHAVHEGQWIACVVLPLELQFFDVLLCR
jgi:hypothetical protein